MVCSRKSVHHRDGSHFLTGQIQLHLLELTGNIRHSDAIKNRPSQMWWSHSLSLTTRVTFPMRLIVLAALWGCIYIQWWCSVAVNTKNGHVFLINVGKMLDHKGNVWTLHRISKFTLMMTLTASVLWFWSIWCYDVCSSCRSNFRIQRNSCRSD